MNSQAYEQIMERVNRNYFNTVAVYNKQVQRMLRGDGYSFQLPALFVEVEEDNYQALLNGITSSDLIINFHIIMEELDSGDGNLDQNINIFQYRNNIKSTFSLFKLQQGGPFVWLDEDEDYNHDNIYHYILGYKCYYIDFVGERKYPNYIQSEIIWNTEPQAWDNDNFTWDTLLFGPLLNITP